MKTFKELTEAKEIITLNVGDSFKSVDGPMVKVLSITLIELHKQNPDVMIEYRWYTAKEKGVETKRLQSFAKDIVRGGSI